MIVNCKFLRADTIIVAGSSHLLVANLIHIMDTVSQDVC